MSEPRPPLRPAGNLGGSRLRLRMRSFSHLSKREDLPAPGAEGVSSVLLWDRKQGSWPVTLGSSSSSRKARR